MPSRTSPIALLTGLFLGVLSGSAQAATIIVNTDSDNVTSCSTTGVGTCSLRDAINYANAHIGLDEIDFDIPGDGFHEIFAVDHGFEITDHVIIDGYTQPGSSPNTLAVGDNAVILIGVTSINDPSGFGTDTFKTIAPIPPSPLVSGSTIQGLVIRAFGTTADFGTPFGVNLQSCCNTVRGNFIGTDGKQAWFGPVLAASNHNLIGGTTPASRNVISANPQDLSSGNISNVGVSGSENTVQGNYIGTDASGLIGISTFDCVQSGFCGALGVGIEGARHQIGGTAPGAANVISGNGNGGIGICANASAVVGNVIGPGADLKTRIGNGADENIDSDGVGLGSCCSPSCNAVGNLIAENDIAFNAPAGIKVQFPSSPAQVINNALLRNSIHQNSGLGISLGFDGTNSTPTPNDPQDPDTGPNQFQNYPVLTSAQQSGSKTVITGTLNSLPKTGFHIEFFVSGKCDPSGYGEGRRFLGAIQVKTDAKGDASFTFAVPKLLKVGAVVTSTATGGVSNTSEFSACVTVQGPPS